MKHEHPLRRWRKEHKMRQGELAEKIGIGPTQVSQIESGTKGCSLAVALKIKALAGDAVPLESLLPKHAEEAG